MNRPPKANGRGFPTLAGIFLGLGLGGFFDGIISHQILQWHFSHLHLYFHSDRHGDPVEQSKEERRQSSEEKIIEVFKQVFEEEILVTGKTDARTPYGVLLLMQS